MTNISSSHSLGSITPADRSQPRPLSWTQQQQVDFWCDYLAGAPALLELPTDRPRPQVPGHPGSSRTFTLDTGLFAAIRELGRRHDATLFMTLLAAFSALLSRLSGQSDLVIGTAVANRHRAELEPLNGSIANTLAMRVRFDDSLSVAGLLARVRSDTLAACAHQDISFEQIVEAIQPVRSLSHTPLFQVMLELDTTPLGGEIKVPDLPLSEPELSRDAASFDLTLSITEAGDSLAGTINYATDLFDASSIERMIGQFRLLLAAMVADDTCAVASLPLLSAEERQQVVDGFNDTAIDYPANVLIHQLVEQQAAQRPEAVALVFEGQSLCYGELNERANRLAHHLIALGVKPDDRVGICVERGIGMVVGLLATLKAGAGYVPLDPVYPLDRLAYIIGDAKPVTVLIQSGLLDRVPAGYPVVDIGSPVAEMPAHNPLVADLSARHLAYVIYTSGSTGMPKGVMIEHRQLSHFIFAQQDIAHIEPNDRVLQFASIAFDVSVSEIFTTLAFGARLIVRPSRIFAPNHEFIALLKQQGVTVVDVPMAFLNQWIHEIQANRNPPPDNLRLIFVGGEKADFLRIKTWSQNPVASRCVLVNAYGPTETTVHVTTYAIKGPLPSELNDLPIGRPIANTRIYILDARGAPVPIGVSGEIFIGGAGVARGYLNRPDLTAERFLADPFSTRPEARMYKTGDLGRWLPDGNIEYLGRNDFQVKIRGFRIELGEIEARLAACEGVRESVVIAREDVPGDKRLVAYFVTGDGVEPSATDLRAQLSADLPAYMLPSAFVQIDALPLTANGKVDRKALPVPGQDALISHAYEAPSGDIETAIADIWQELLHVGRVGRRDNFFDLGGHSLLAVQLTTRIAASLGTDLPLRDLFAHPVLCDLAQALASATPSSFAPITLMDRSQPLPLSWAQQRLWFIDRLDHSAGAAYHMPVPLRLTGQLNRSALTATLDAILARHEALRTTFVTVDGQPVQHIAPEDTCCPLPLIDLRHLPHEQRLPEALRIAAEEFATPFDLAVGPLFYCRLVCLDDDDHALLINQHHIVSDGWSVGVLIRELSTLYAAIAQGQPALLPALPIQYADYAAWQRSWLQGEALEQQVDFWRDYLAGAPALLELPTDRPRPQVQSHLGSYRTFTLDAGLVTGIRELSRRHGATLFMTLLAAFSTLLSRLSGQSDVVIGTPVANRRRAELEPLIGFFVNTLAMRVQFGDTLSVADLLARVKHDTVAAWAHQDIPFERVVEALKPPRSLSHSPLFQVMLALDNTPAAGEFDLPCLSLSEMELSHRAAHFDLTLTVRETGDLLVGTVEYATALFDGSSIERMIERFRLLLTAMVADDTCAVARLPLLSEAERQQVLDGFNDTAADYPADSLIHQLFEQQAAHKPDAVAVVFEGQSLSYAALNARANQLAHRLIAMGVQPDDRVAICVERSADMVAGLLAILKSGAGYVPLDPDYPAERLAYMLADAAPTALLTQSHLATRLPAHQLPTLQLDEAAASGAMAPQPDTNPVVPGLNARNLAYVIYTSGSTGEPKGVAIEHRNANNFIRWSLDSFPVETLDKSVFATSINFDLAVFELFAPLSAGTTIVVARKVTEVSYAAANPTLLNTVPSAINALLGARALPSSLHAVNVAGEPLKASLVTQLFADTAVQRLCNLYGPTETTTYSTWVSMDRESGFVPHIGRPVANTQIYILDAHGAPVPVGVSGEIFIGGAGVARGYLNRPDLTAERFLADPFSTQAEARMYKTGDLGRWLPDGNIEYLGRNDFQVKIRGFRIELGEIETRLGACEGVRDAVVIAREDIPGDKRLVAYFVAAAGAEPTAAGLRAQLAADLPDYMLPSAFVRLDALPLTPNGKLDRKALPVPDLDAMISRTYEAPVGPVEKVLADIWQELLRVERVGRQDNFFELGGHSLLAVQLAARVAAALGADLPLRELFAHPVLCDLAQALANAAPTSFAPITLVDRSQPLALSWAQQRLWFLDQLDRSASAAYYMPAALRLSGQLNRSALGAALDAIVARHESLRTTFVTVDGQPLQCIAPADIGCPLPLTDLRHLPHEQRLPETLRIAAEEFATSFDLSTGPLFRGRLVCLDDDDHALLINQHHIVSDGWSIGVLVRELSTLYAAIAQVQTALLPPLPIQYADYAAWQRTWLQGRTLQQQVDFWRDHLAGAPALLELPTDRPRPQVQSYLGSYRTFTLDTGLAASVRELGRRHGATLFMTLLAAFSTLLSRLSGQSDVVIGTPVANRNRAELEPLIGFFVNTLPLRVQFNDGLSVTSLLARIRHDTLAAWAHQDIPFEQIVEAVQPPRSLSHAPLFQAMLVLNNTPPDGDLNLPGLSLSELELPHPVARVDLTLSFEETAEGLSGLIEYATDLFDASTIERMVERFRLLLTAMVADDTCAVARLPLLSDAERQQVLEGFNNTAADYPADSLIHQLFEQQAAHKPDAVAVIFEDQSLSYAALNARANQLAHRLIAMGVKPDDRVAICVERSADMVAGLLAILKSGAGYVPLDPDYPAERLAYMLADAAPTALLTQSHLATRLPAHHLPTLELDDPAAANEQITQEANTNPVVPGLSSRNLAYVIYTSGSTGEPKGVAIEHRNANNFIRWSLDSFPVETLDKSVFATSINFDLAVFELFAPLSAGTTIVVARKVTEVSYAAANPTLLNTVPSAINALLGARALPPSLHAVNVAGEPLKASLVTQLFADTAVQRLCNLYGPTETTTYSTWVSMDRESGFVPHIGRPVANTQIYILDAHGAPVPVGVTGEIFIGGAGVARGYLNRPDLTAERFLADPFSTQAEARMYKTGDLGRWLPDGNIEYLGRNDFQVKIRGFRIELGEIETRLGACAGVVDAVVIAREDIPGDKRLVAYFVAAGGAEPTAAGLRAQLAADLPEYMLPSAFVRLDALPLTPNGKLDRKALPVPDLDALISRAYEAPVGPVEKVLADIWQELLRVERVGRQDNFFELGGHSLLAVQLAARVAAALGADLPLRELFAHPVLCDLAQALANAAPTSFAPITLVDRSQPLALSWAQQRLWFLDQLDRSASAAYYMPAALRLTGQLNRSALGAALDAIVARHESLRTTFVTVDGQPLQCIAPADIGCPLPLTDLRHLPHEQRLPETLRIAAEEFATSFDLAIGPLFRGRLVCLDDDDHALLINQHHIVSDGWSIGVLVRELSTLYAAIAQVQTALLPPLPIQYADYAAWQRTWLQGRTLQQQVDFWRDHLTGAPALLELPTDRPRPQVQSYLGSYRTFTLDAGLAASVRELGRRHGATLFMTLLAAFSTLLSRLSGQSDVVIGTPVANRNRAELEPLIGFFVNTLPLRVQFNDGLSVTSLLARIRHDTLAAWAHQDIPFEQIVEAVQPPRSLSHAPLFQAMLVLNNTPPDGDLNLPGLSLSELELPHPVARVDLTLSFEETAEGLSGLIEYATDLFDASTIERMVERFRLLLTAMVADDTCAVARLPLLSDAERQQVLEGFNNTAADYPADSLIHQLFEQQAAHKPDAVAVIFEDQSLSYAALNARANQLAHRLIAMGVKPDDRVAICVERSADMVAGLLAILKSGAGYVPLDPDYPAERLAYMLADAAPTALLTQSHLATRLPAHQLPTLQLDEAAASGAMAQQPDTNPVVPGLNARNLAYVIYTSGSTGEPKGVAIEHRNANNFIRWSLDSFPVETLDKSVFATSINFDLAVFELFAPLSAGTTIVVARKVTEVSYAAANPTLLNTVPSAINALLGARALPSSLHAVNVAGEPLKASLVTQLFADTAVQRLCNLYGPTETTTYSTWTSMDRASGFVPHIGRPVANTQIYILDAHGAPVPVGVTGEIFIGGAGVARGYLNRPDLTAERFLIDPFSTQPEARMYKTGDLGRWLPDGNIEYLGRNDFQVKIRGFRIELGEIETRLGACEGVRDAVVIAREDIPGDKRLVAYFVAAEGAEPAVAGLRAQLAADLPDYMLPSAFVRLDALPLTPNGKLDRKALPVPDLDALISRAYEAPVGPVEKVIADIWQELLRVERVGRQDNFFELGGHSLLAVQLAARVAAALGADLPLRELFAHPVLCDLAQALANAAPTSFAPITLVDRSQPLALSWAQQRLWFIDQLDRSASAAYYMPAALRLSGQLNRSALGAALDAIVARHESLRTTFVTVDGQPLQCIAPADIGCPLPLTDLRHLPHEQRLPETLRIAAEEFATPFDLATGPLFRARLVCLDDDDHALLINQHHIVSDGWSIGVLVRELSALYAAIAQGKAAMLAPLPIQYADYAAWQRTWLQGRTLQQQVDFWRDHLTGAPALLELPTDRPRPQVQSYLGSYRDFTFDAGLSDAIRGFSRRHDATLFMTLLAAFSTLLSRLSGQPDVVIGAPVANRRRAELEPLIGFFINTLPIRVQFDDEMSVAGLLARIRHDTLAAYAHQDIPFEQVVEAVQPVRSLSHAPLFQVMLVLNNTPPDGELELPGLSLSDLSLPHPVARVDLTVSFEETAQGLSGSIEYATALFDASTIDRMIERFRRLLTAMVADDTCAIARLPLLSTVEREQLIEGFNDTAADFPSNVLIHQLFEQQAVQRPEAVAVRFGEQSLSYAALNARANQLAHHLIAMGVQPDNRIGICVERSPDMVVGLLAILKAGAAYVPLDPDYPPERLAYMLDDAAPAVLLTQSYASKKLPEHTLPTLQLDNATVIDEIARQPDSNPAVTGLNARNLAYVIYTSGSTGKPKGVANEHRSVVNRLWWALKEYQITSGDCVLQKTPFSFDVSVWEFFLPLLAGAPLLVAKPDGHKDPNYLIETIEKYGVTTLHFVPSMLSVFLDQLAAGRCQRVRQVLCSGEALPYALQMRFFERMPQSALHNLYGPTEAAVDVTTWRCNALQYPGIVPIGHPVANTRLYILDPVGEPVPVGVAGELFIGGIQVARGYLNRPDLTAERFLSDPFSTQPEARMYKTGDLARWLPDGNIEYLGRNDFQVKIRGFRIELGEIEARLATCKGVRDTVVIAREDIPGDKRLVAYFVAGDGAGVTAADLRAQLGADLPDYMLPSAFVQIDALPLTPNGKLDRKALPAPGQSALISRAYEAPVGPVETTIAEVWQELLRVERVGRNDNFFELGGHSLLIVTLIERLRMRQIVVTVRSVFDFPDVASLAANAPPVSEHTADFVIPHNLIPENCTAITPSLLPLVTLTQSEVDHIGNMVSGGISNIQDIYPLAPLQEGILFHHLLEEEGDTYLSRTTITLESQQHLNTFLSGLRAVIDRHDIFRTAFFWTGLSQPVQVVLRKAALEVHDHVIPPHGDGIQYLCELTDLSRIQLNLNRAPLIVAHTTHDSHTGKWVCVLVHHHLVDDHITLELMFREIDLINNGYADELPRPQPYRNFIAKVRSVSSAKYESYFRQRLGDIESPTAPFGLLDVLSANTSVSKAVLPVNADLASRVRSTARRLMVTPAVLFHAAWARVLAGCTGLDNVVFGTVLSGRMQSSIATDQMLGLFINTLPLRVSLGQRSVMQVLAEIKVELVALLDHEQAPLALAQRCSNVAPPLPLYTSLLNYRHELFIEDEIGTIESDFDIVGTEERSNYPLTISVDENGNNFDLSVIASSGIDPERVVGYMHCAISGLVDAVADSPDLPISHLPILPLHEREQLIHGFNDTAVDYPAHALIHQLFEQQVARQPDAVAVVFEDQPLSYAGLNARANQLAHRLIAMGVQPDNRVALCVERSADMVVGLLAILKAGAGYVPLDPDYPAERLAYMLADAAPTALLTQTHLATKLPPHALPTLQLDDAVAMEAIAQEPNTNPLVAGLSSRNLAYVIYTSGSTGEPKGVMVEHRNVLRLVIGSTFAPIIPNDCVAQCANVAFDASTWEIWAPLLNGARLLIVPQATVLNPPLFGDTLVKHGATSLWLTVGLFNQYAGLLGHAFATLRHLLVGGDVLDPAIIRRLIENGHAPARLVNGYGPTESTTFAATYTITSVASNAVSIPIGRPIANTSIYILDAHGAPVPVGVTGEIFIGGDGVARGYLNRPDLTAQRFVADPFSSQLEARMYKTGDLGRWLPDGNIEYLGRNDFQVKIRGFRIELGEIEARIAACAGVRETVVIAREDIPGDKRLVAYVVASEGAEPAAADLRAQLAADLPDYMLPAAFVQLEALPLTPNGKLDRKALPAPGQDALISRAFEAPVGEIETAIAEIWQELLHVERVGRHDNFFELGGHSLLIVTLIEHMRVQDIHITVRSVFDFPTVASLAASIGSAIAVKPVEVPPNAIPDGCTAITPSMLPLVTLSQIEIDRIAATVPGGIPNIQDIYPLAPLQEGILFHHLLEHEGDAYLTRFMMAFDSRERLDAFVAAIRHVINRHDILRTAFCWHDLSQPVQVVLRQVTLNFHTHALTGDIEARFDELTNPRHRRLDLTQAPLIEAHAAFDPQSNEWRFAMLNHHMVIDHVTLEKIFDEVSLIMQQQHDRLPIALPYRNFIAQVLSVPVSVHETYFREQLGDIDSPTAPFGVIDVLGDGNLVVEARIALDPALARQLRLTARRLAVSPSVLFHLAWAQVLSLCTGQDDVVFGTVLAGRLQGSAGADQVLGLFINALPVRISLAGHTVLDAVNETRRRLTDLLEHEQTPLAVAQRCSAVPSPLPLFTTLLNYRHTAPFEDDEDVGWAGIRIVSGEERTNYPLTLSVDDLEQDFAIGIQANAAINAERVIAYMAAAVAGLAEALAHAPATPIHSVPVLPLHEREQLIHGFNDTAVDYPANALIHQIFEQQAAQRPDAVAVVFEDHSLSYAGLNLRANQLAHRLIAMGVQPDDRVALCIERGPDMVAGLLAILKAGAGYVPLDPDYPAERLAYMLADAAPTALLTQSHLANSLPAHQLSTLQLDGTGAMEAIAQEANTNPVVPGLSSRNLAYIIYTSGSTGEPKGVMVEHRNVLRLVIGSTFAPITPDDCVAQCANVAFDASTWEIWAALLNGARTLIVPQATVLNPPLFGDTLVKQGATSLWLTVGLFNQYAGLLGQAFATLRQLLVGGDVLDPAIIRRFIEDGHAPARLVNGYGPTESTTFAATYAIASVASNAVSIPIGRPIANTSIYILNAHGAPVPVGVAGEIFIGGDGVARGYLNRPELTAERFVADPFSSQLEARMYKTGDLGRWLPDGNIEYLGRNDFQVKIRGFRIELGEIEARIAACAGVRETVVIAREDVPGDKRLVAYVLASEGAEPAAAVLRAQLAADLPDYMLPSAFVLLDALPLTPNGKLDRKALPAPGQDALISRAFEAPVGEIETAIAEIWQELLHVERVGRHDNFFELGGHSLLAVQLGIRIQQRLKIELSILAIFTTPGLIALAETVLARQVETYLDTDMQTLQAELDSMSEEELIAMLEQDNLK